MGFPDRIKVKTTSLRASLAYAIGALGMIPVRYNEAPFLSVRRRYVNDTHEARLLKLNNDVMPRTFALTTFSSIAKATTRVQGNQAALNKGLNLGKNNGSVFRIHGAFVELACNTNIYSDNMDTLLSWVSEVVQHPKIIGKCEFDDGTSFNIEVVITPNFTFTDPIEASEGGMFLDRFYNLEFSFIINTIAASIQAIPLMKAIIESVGVEGEATSTEIEIPLNDPEDWP